MGTCLFVLAVFAIAFQSAQCCDPDPCLDGKYCENGGTCSSNNCSVDTRHCFCSVGYAGGKCQNRVPGTTRHSPTTILLQLPVTRQPDIDTTAVSTSHQPGRVGTDTTTIASDSSKGKCQEICDWYNNFCQNGGTCIGICTGSYGYQATCVCPPLFTGKKCQTSVYGNSSSPLNTTRTTKSPGGGSWWCPDICDEHPNYCQNGGTCSTRCAVFQLKRETVCDCPPMFTGSRCLIPVNENTTHPSTLSPFCASWRCNNGVKNCVNNTVSCKCHKGWTGELCSMRCSLDCGDHGLCVMDHTVPSGQRCSCPHCYKGDHCEVQFPEYGHNCPCTRNCSNRGDCYINENNKMMCDCHGNYTGEQCEVYVDPPSAVDPDYWWIVGGCIALLIVLLVLLFLIPYCMYKKRIEIALRVAYFFRKFEDDDDNDFDAFVSYCSNDLDEGFVVRKLFHILEQQHGFKLCLHFRDFQPGVLIVDNILQSLTRSRRTILIISPRYLESAYCRMEYEIAHEEMLKLKNKIIPIIFEDIDHHANINKHLKMILNTVTYEKWPGDENPRREQKFWKKILLSMPKKKHKKEFENLADVPPEILNENDKQRNQLTPEIHRMQQEVIMDIHVDGGQVNRPSPQFNRIPLDPAINRRIAVPALSIDSSVESISLVGEGVDENDNIEKVNNGNLQNKHEYPDIRNMLERARHVDIEVDI